LPEPSWDGHPDEIACYWKVWELAFGNIFHPTPRNGFVASYIDTAFNKHLFMWDSAFILMFARYGKAAFDFQRTLDNLYCKQHPDGFICREIDEASGLDLFEHFHPASTGPNTLAWTEWEYYLNFADKDRLGRVFPVLAAYHQWLRMNRTWPDGGYWSSGWGVGMDNQPRIPDTHVKGYEDPDQLRWWSHAHMTWVDVCLQQLLSAKLLVQFATELGRTADAADFDEEVQSLTKLVNDVLWDDPAAFYYDRLRDGSLSKVQSIGAFWAVIAGATPKERLPRLIAHLEDPKKFNRPHRVPSLAADDPDYQAIGDYWRGGIWAPTNYMVLRGLTSEGYDRLAHEIAANHVANVTQVFRDTGTVWEDYAPESAVPAKPARKDFVGWSGMGPVAVLFEYLFGLRPDAAKSTLTWDIRLTEGFGVKRYPFGRDGQIDLSCAARGSAHDEPQVTIASNIPVDVEILWEGGSKRMKVGA
jgi:hypothetical protein